MWTFSRPRPLELAIRLGLLTARLNQEASQPEAAQVLAHHTLVLLSRPPPLSLAHSSTPVSSSPPSPPSTTFIPSAIQAWLLPLSTTDLEGSDFGYHRVQRIDCHRDPFVPLLWISRKQKHRDKFSHRSDSHRRFVTISLPFLSPALSAPFLPVLSRRSAL